jgi:hypothetical protein
LLSLGAPATRQTSHIGLAALSSAGVMLAVTGTGAPSIEGGLSYPTTPSTPCHQADGRELSSREDTYSSFRAAALTAREAAVELDVVLIQGSLSCLFGLG